MDRIYLDSPGWRGIRLRRNHLESLLTRAIEITQAEGRPVRILDVACGLGRYVLETLARLPRSQSVEAHLRDWDPGNVAEARELARSLDLSGVTFSQGDAFDLDSLASLRPRPSIAVVSGLYELFPANDAVRQSLEGIASALLPGGLFIYTNQPWHPQLDLIARVLDNREGKPWIMRCRPQAEMNELVRSAGFEPLDLLTGGDGIFTVSIARLAAPA
jgi:SAM-dependent methyltransferase